MTDEPPVQPALPAVLDPVAVPDGRYMTVLEGELLAMDASFEYGRDTIVNLRVRVRRSNGVPVSVGNRIAMLQEAPSA